MQGVYVQFGEDIFHFTCDENSCQWDTLEQKLSNPVTDTVMMYLPPEYQNNCKKPGKERSYTHHLKFIECLKFVAYQVKKITA